MVCVYCKEEFKIETKQGGHNRLFCYKCMPSGLDKSERTKLKRILFYNLSDKDKLDKGCCQCGYRNCPTALEWHHSSQDDKEFNPSDKLRLGTTKAFEEYLEEIKKCELLCANCHREKHYTN